MGTKKKKEPLLYIDQPILEKPKAFMQENYSSLTRQNKESTNIPIKERVGRERRHRENPFLDMFQERELDNELETVENEHKVDDIEKFTPKNNNIKFNDLSIQGKIDYFINLPKEMPKMRSEIELSNDVFRGFILEDNGTEIIIKTGRFIEKINKEDIKNIVLIGF